MTKFIQLQFYQGAYNIDLEYVVNTWLDNIGEENWYDNDGNNCSREIAFKDWIVTPNDAADLIWDLPWNQIKDHLIFVHNETTYPSMEEQWEKEGNVHELGVFYEAARPE